MIGTDVVFFAALLAAVALAQFCPNGYTDLNQGTPCNSDSFCSRFDPTYRCMKGFCCRQAGICGPNEVSIANMCFTKSYIGGPCFHSAQCQPSGGECRNNVCVAIQSDTASFCLDPSHQPERINGIVKNCMYTPCSPGYRCLFNQAYGQYFCCGQSDPGYDYNYGNSKIRMYPGTLQPLQCFAKDQCLWVDTPNCVYSYRYKQYVCCSTFNC